MERGIWSRRATVLPKRATSRHILFTQERGESRSLRRLYYEENLCVAFEVILFQSIASFFLRHIICDAFTNDKLLFKNSHL